MRGSHRGAPVRAGVPLPRPPRADLPPGHRGRAGLGAPGGARRPGRGLLPWAGRRPEEAGASWEGRAGAGTRAEAATRAASPGPAPAPGAAHWLAGPERRRRPAGRGPRSGFRAATSAGTRHRGRRAADSVPGHRTGPPPALPLCPGPENPAPSRPFERWILLTYLAALASRVESWVLPDRAGLVFVTLGQPRIPPKPGECASASREPSCPPMPRPGVAAPARAFCHVRHRTASSQHFCVRFSGAFCYGGSYRFSPRWLFRGWGCALCVCLFAV